MKKKPQFKSLSNVFVQNNLGSTKTQSGPSRFQSDTFDFIALIERWPEIVGERMSKHTIPLKNQYGTLTVLTNHSAFSQQLGFMEDILKKKIFEVFPGLKTSIRKLNFRMDTTHFNTQVERHRPEDVKETKREQNKIHPFSPEYRALKAKAQIYFADVEEDEVRDSLINIYIQGKYGN